MCAVSGVPSWSVGVRRDRGGGRLRHRGDRGDGGGVAAPTLLDEVGKPSPGSIASSTAPVMTASTMITKPRVFWNHCSTP